MLFRVRVVSYNVLSSHLASPSQYPSLDPNHLLAANRLPVVLQKIEEALAENNSNDGNGSSGNIPTVVCLQEVSYDWAGAFHTWFANRGYHLVTGLYGKKFNGYMGVAMAYPTAFFETQQVRIDRLSDTKSDWPRPPIVDDDSSSTPPPSLVKRLVKQTQQLIQSSTKTVLGLVTLSLKAITGGSSASFSKKQEPIEHWSYAENRHNVLLCATLRDRQTGQSFCIGNYHMPCAFYAPMVMTIHADLAAHHLQECAGEGVPFMLAGDWNIKPGSPTYQMLTTGQLGMGDTATTTTTTVEEAAAVDTDDEATRSFPTPLHGTHWSVSAKAMKSAYAVAQNGREPDFTNYACLRDDPDNCFIDTLDYIFLSDQWKVTHVKPIPDRSEAEGPFPNLDHGEPSDHVLIYADLELKSNN